MGLAAVFVGPAVATASASRGHYYSGPGNKFWELLFDAGLTGERRLVPEQDSTFLAKLDCKPWAIAFNGKEAARRVFRFLGEVEPGLGRTSTRVGDARVLVLPSSSGANADRRNFAPKTSKAEWWREFGE